MRQRAEDTDKQCTCYLAESVAYCAQTPWIFSGTIKVKGSVICALLRRTSPCVLLIFKCIHVMIVSRFSFVAWLHCSYLTELEVVKGRRMWTICSMITGRSPANIHADILANQKLHVY